MTKEEKKLYKAEYHRRNREKLIEKTRQWRLANLDYYREKQKEYGRIRRTTDPDLVKRRARGYALKRKYGITLEQYEELLSKQNDSCAVCLKHKDDFNVNLAVDHDHHTGEIRGLLCTYCNHRVIGRHRDGALLRKLADYVEQGTGWFVPKKKPSKRKKIEKQ